MSPKDEGSPKYQCFSKKMRALNKSESSNRLYIKKVDARSRTISIQNHRKRTSSLINNDMNSPSISLTKDIRFCKALPVSNFNVQPTVGKSSKKNSKNKNSSVCRFKRSTSSPSPVANSNRQCEQNVVSTINI